MTEVKEHNTFYSEEGVNEKNTKEVDTLWKHAVYNAKKKDYFDLEKECYLCTKHEVPLIRFHAFDDYEEVNAFFSTRFGGESTGYLSSLNLGFERGDSLETVERNIKGSVKVPEFMLGILSYLIRFTIPKSDMLQKKIAAWSRSKRN